MITKQHRNLLLNESFINKYLTEDVNDDKITVFMNTWANYNEYGADSGITPTGWMTPEEALEYCEEYSEYEPFINDIDNPTDVDLNISEYGNVIEDLETIQSVNDLNDDDLEIIGAILEDQGGSFKDALEIFEDGNYVYYPGVSTEEELAYEALGGDWYNGMEENIGFVLKEHPYYIDEEAMKRDYEDDVRRQLYDEAEDEGLSEDEIEDYIDEHIDDYLDSIVQEEIELAAHGDVDLSNYFDFKQYGRDIAFDYTFTKNGAIGIF